MLDSRAKFLVIFLVSVLLTAEISILEAFGQVSAPVKLIEPKQLKSDRRSEPNVSSERNLFRGYRAKPEVRSLTGIQVKPLDQVDISALGLLSNAEGGFGADLWKGSRLSFIRLLLKKYPVKNKSIVMRRLLRRVLLTGAAPPEGSKGSAFILLRLEVLMALGDFDAGLKLLKSVPRENREGLFRKLETEMLIAIGKADEACETVATEVTQIEEPFWQKALIYCEIMAGKMVRAELGVSLLQENETIDETFVALARGILDDQPTLPEVIQKFDVLNLAMLKLANLQVPLELARNSPAALVGITSDPLASEYLDAIEIAAQEGLLGDDELRKRYLAALPASSSVSDFGNPTNKSSERAKLFLEAIDTEIPMAKAEALERVMKSARKAGRLGGVSRLFRPVISGLVPENDLLWVAPLAFRVSLLSGQWKLASSWLGLAKRNASFSPDASAIYSSLTTLGALTDTQLSTAASMVAIKNLSVDQKILYLSLFHALGGDVPVKILEALAYRSERPALLPDPILWQQLTRFNQSKELENQSSKPNAASTLSLDTVISEIELKNKKASETDVIDRTSNSISFRNGMGLKQKKLGEMILVMLAVMGDQSLMKISPLVVAEVVYGLRKSGLYAEAHGLAVETAINAGL